MKDGISLVWLMEETEGKTEDAAAGVCTRKRFILSFDSPGQNQQRCPTVRLPRQRQRSKRRKKDPFPREK